METDGTEIDDLTPLSANDNDADYRPDGRIIFKTDFGRFLKGSDEQTLLSDGWVNWLSALGSNWKVHLLPEKQRLQRSLSDDPTWSSPGKINTQYCKNTIHRLEIGKSIRQSRWFIRFGLQTSKSICPPWCRTQGHDGHRPLCRRQTGAPVVP